MNRRTSAVVLTVLLALPLACLAQTTQPAQPQRARIQTEDGVTLAADYYAPTTKTSATQPAVKAPVLILLHMYPADRTSWRPLATRLAAQGVACLAFDLRGTGQSTGPADMKLAQRYRQQDAKLFAEMHQDVAAVDAWLAAKPGLDMARIGLVGASIGCSIAMDYARRDKSIDVVVCLSPGTSYFGVNSISHIRRIGSRPVLLMAGDEERHACDTLAAQAAAATVQIYPMGSYDGRQMHGTNLLQRVDQATDEVVAFLIEHLGQPSTQPVIASVQSEVYHHPTSPIVGRIKPSNLRTFSSAAEAEARGLRPSKR